MAEVPVYPLQRCSDGILEMCFMQTELRKNCCVTRSPPSKPFTCKDNFWLVVTAAVDRFVVLLCKIGSDSVPPCQGQGQEVCLLLLLPPLLLLLCLSCPQQGHVFDVGYSVPLRWLFGPFIAAVPPVLAWSSCQAPAHILPTEPSVGRVPFGSGRFLKPRLAVCCHYVSCPALAATFLPVV